MPRVRRRAQGRWPARIQVCAVFGRRNAVSKRTVSPDMEEAFDRAGFDKNQRIHALRYTAATRLLETGFPYHSIQELTGHRMAEMAKKCTERKHQAPVVAQTFDRLDAMTSAQDNEAEAGGDAFETSQPGASANPNSRTMVPSPSKPRAVRLGSDPTDRPSRSIPRRLPRAQ
ncbi:hypothetical protein FHG66_04630 [Rubellimicrobium rubrum]|uniref:Tyr recombinase domain-containing protein n=1 Tax=Rubellimicrobium rubrum TaxID=2585369 RepID=A0A5C4N4X7_9RHOB|nr:hypothetical protein FHG66_04630 [Rubellimicrobium rubrum]